MALPREKKEVYGANRMAVIDSIKEDKKVEKKQTRSKHVSAMLTPDDFSKLRIAAAKQNKTMSAFVSDLISLAVHKEQLAW